MKISVKQVTRQQLILEMTDEDVVELVRLMRYVREVYPSHYATDNLPTQILEALGEQV